MQMTQRTAHFREWLIFAASVVVLGGWLGYSSYHDYRHTEEVEKQRLASQATVMEEMIAHQFESINNTLAILQKDISYGKMKAANVDHTNERLKAFVSAMTPVRTLLILDKSGNAMSSDHQALIGQNFYHRAYFQAPLKNPSQDTLYISPPFRTTRGAWTMNLTRVLVDHKGAFSGIVTASLDPNEFKVLLNSTRYSSDMWTSIVHGAGSLYMVQPDREDILGINLNVPSSFFTRHMESGQEASVATGTLYATGEARMMATNLVRPSNLNMDYPVMVAASRNLDSIYSGWKKETILHGGLFVLLFVVSAIGLLLSQKRRQTTESEKQAAELQLNEAKNRLENFFNIAPDLLCIASAEGRFLKLNPSWETVLGYPISELENTQFLDYVHPDDVGATISTMSALGKGERVTNFTNRYRHRNGSYRYIEWRTAPHGNLLYAAARDVSERMQSENEMRHRAFYDDLTQLPNRGLLLERLQQEIAHAKRDKTLLALLFIDLDKFKPVNDEHGHVVGDWLLQMVAQRIERCIRESDTAARLGGDEFVVLLPNMSSVRDVLPTAEKIREVLEQPFITSDGLSLEISSSIGIAVYPNDATGAQELLLLGDDAMYMAKDAGRNRVKFLQNLA